MISPVFVKYLPTIICAVTLAGQATFISRAEEEHTVLTGLSSTTLSGFVDTSALWWFALPTLPYAECVLMNGKPQAFLHGVPGQECEIAVSIDLTNWFVLGDFVLQNEITPLPIASGTENLFYRISSARMFP